MRTKKTRTYDRRRAVNDLREYRTPRNKLPFSNEGMLEFSERLLEVAKQHDSPCHEMAGLVIRRLIKGT